MNMRPMQQIDPVGGLARVLEEQTGNLVFSPGSVIFEEGESNETAYLIERGHVRIVQNLLAGPALLGILGPGEVFGEMAPIDRQQRSASAIAVDEVEVVPISAENLQRAMEKSHPVVNLLLRVMLARLRTTQSEDNNPAMDLMTRATAKFREDTREDFERARKAAVSRIETESNLKDALRRREFELHFQPIINVADKRLLGFEALIRWLSPDQGLVSPFDFIPLAEETGMIVPIGLWVVEHACHWLQRFNVRHGKTRHGDKPLFMCANVSGRQLENAQDVEDLAGAINHCGVDPSLIKLEITEGVLMENPQLARQSLEKLRQLGLSLAIDDFGTGYSSLSYLHRFPLDTLKIDRSFVNTMSKEEGSLQVVQGIIGLAVALQLDTVGEGVESEADLQLLKTLGCDMAQGYFFAKPLPSDDALAFVDDYRGGK